MQGILHILTVFKTQLGALFTQVQAQVPFENLKLKINLKKEKKIIMKEIFCKKIFEKKYFPKNSKTYMTQAIKGAAGLLCHFIWITEQPDQTVRETQQISTNFFFFLQQLAK